MVRLKSIEACRGVAATMVLASHCGHTLGAPMNFGAPPFGLIFQFGRSGADLFFVLSGFLISFIHWKDIGHPERLKHYLARRATRIYPTYWLVLFAVIPFDLVTHTLYDKYDQPLEIIKNILLLPQDDQIIDVAWSLCNELLFYIMFGLLILNRKLGFAAVVLWVLTLILRPLVTPDINVNWYNLITYPMNFEFITGVIAGWALQRTNIPRPEVVLATGIAIFSIAATAEDHRLLWSHELDLWFPGIYWNILMLRCLGYGSAYLLIISGLSALELRKRLWTPRPLVTLGGASYLLYLIHIPALLILGAGERHAHLLRYMQPWLLAALFMAFIIAGAIGLHIGVERPLLREVRPRKSAGATEPISAPI